MAFPGGFAGMPGQQVNDGMDEQQRKMVKVVRLASTVYACRC